MPNDELRELDEFLEGIWRRGPALEVLGDAKLIVLMEEIRVDLENFRKSLE